MKSSAKHKKQINNYEVYPKSGVAETMVHQNMSSHYRRVYNAKPQVDCGPPFSHKTKPILPSKPFSSNWNKNHTTHASKQSIRLPLSSTNYSGKVCSMTENSNFHQQTRKSNADSKLRSMRVYHPPRKRKIVKSLHRSSSIQVNDEVTTSNQEVHFPEIPWTHSKDLKSTPCDGSSSDSAYTEEGDGGWSQNESRGQTPESDTPRVVNSSDNLMYIKFVRGITEEVLKKGIYTDKALKEIFQNHIDSHKQFLNVRRMLEEVSKLQAELGILDKSNLVLEGREFDHRLDFSTICENSRAHSSINEDQEILDALSQLNISPLLKADIASSLGLHSKFTLSNTGSSLKSIHKFNAVKNSHGVKKQATISTSLEKQTVKKYDRNHKLPQSDDDSYEMLSESSESRPITPLGITW